ncbi:MAG: hypothetical protein DIJKHBIC_03470 [Thermoanaerobaculia bacterium]|nr:hypothetical protein [Thermoanaerobaculia bacterium]
MTISGREERVVVDTSALLAILFSEPHGEWAADRLTENAGDPLLEPHPAGEALVVAVKELE